MAEKKEAKADAKIKATKEKPSAKKEGKKTEVKAAAKKEIKEEKKENVVAQTKPAAKADAKQIEAEMHGLEVIKYPLITEKAVNMIDDSNKLTFIVQGNTTKGEVRKAVEEVYKVKVTKINVIRDMKSRKKAIVTLDKKFKASDIATKLGVV